MKICRECGEKIEQEKTEERYWCEGCGQEVEEPEPKYECDCGEEFVRSESLDGMSHKCPSCGKWGHKVEDEACPDCGEPVELVEGFVCGSCGAFTPASEVEEAGEEPKAGLKLHRGQRLVLLKDYEIAETYPSGYVERRAYRTSQPTFATIERREGDHYSVQLLTMHQSGQGQRYSKLTEREISDNWKLLTEEEFTRMHRGLYWQFSKANNPYYKWPSIWPKPTEEEAR